MDRQFSAMRLFDFEDDVQREVNRVTDVAERIKLRNRLIANRLEADMRRAGWRKLSKGDVLPLHDHANVFVIGVVNWDHKSLQILSNLAIQETRHAIYVFDLDDVHSFGGTSSFYARRSFGHTNADWR